MGQCLADRLNPSLDEVLFQVKTFVRGYVGSLILLFVQQALTESLFCARPWTRHIEVKKNKIPFPPVAHILAWERHVINSIIIIISKY